MEDRFFPFFIPSKGKKVTVFGGGVIGTRRTKTLATFDFDILLISRSVSHEIEKMAEYREIDIQRMDLKEMDLEKAMERSFFVLACTDDRQLNKSIGEQAKRMKIPVSVCDAQEECDFYFPAIAVNDKITVGLVGDGKTHKETRKAATRLRGIVEEKDY